MVLIETKLATDSIARLATACLLFFTSAVNAATDAKSAYVDSVHSWGAWELGIEPSAAGPQISQGNIMNNKSLNLQFRPNDNAVYMTSGIEIPPPLPPTPPPPVFSSGITERPNLNPGKPSRNR